MSRISNRTKVETFTNELARLIRASDKPVAQGHTTTGSEMLFVVYDGLAINITITPSRDKEQPCLTTNQTCNP